MDVQVVATSVYAKVQIQWSYRFRFETIYNIYAIVLHLFYMKFIIIMFEAVHFLLRSKP